MRSEQSLPLKQGLSRNPSNHLTADLLFSPSRALPSGGRLVHRLHAPGPGWGAGPGRPHPAQTIAWWFGGGGRRDFNYPRCVPPRGCCSESSVRMGFLFQKMVQRDPPSSRSNPLILEAMEVESNSAHEQAFQLVRLVLSECISVHFSCWPLRAFVRPGAFADY